MKTNESALFIGASRGIGRTFALEAARRGIRPIAVARTFDPDDTELSETGIRVIADVSKPAGMDYLRRERLWHLPYVFWVAGAYRRAPFADTEHDARILDMHQSVMMEMVKELHRARLAAKDAGFPAHMIPYTLVVMGSISSYKLRKGEAVYAAAKAGQAAFLRNYASELAEDLPGSRILLVNCARLGTEPGEQKLDAGGRRLDPGEVSRLVWDLVLDERRAIMNRPFTQVNVERDSNGPIISYGTKLPEIP